MATKYTFYFTDTLKDGFDVQSYTANGIKVPSSVTLLDRASQANTTLKIYGKGLPDYGEGVFQDMIYMLENYAASTIPQYSTEGQIWYNNVGTGTGSPTSGPELFIRKTKTVGPTDGLDIPTDWDAIILASGSSAMTGELSLAGNPTHPTHAVPLSMVTAHTTDFGIHITPEQNTFLDGLDINGSPPNLTATEVNYLSTTTSDVQVQLNDKVSRAGDTMIVGSPPANITFVGGEVLGLPTTPSVDDAAASRRYVDDQDTITATGEVTSISFIGAPAAGSPPAIVDTSLTSALFTITSPTTTYNLQLDDISRHGHTHPALDVTLDNTFNPNYPTDVQNGFEFVEDEIESLKLIAGGGDDLVTSISIERAFEVLLADITSPTPYQVISHGADDNAISITINGIKQYNHTRAYQNIEYATSAVTVSNTTSTGIDQTVDHDFNINVNGAGNVLVSIPSGTDTISHGGLVVAINDIMNATSPPLLGNVTFVIGNNIETFTTSTSGASSTVVVSDPVTANPYLFDVDSAPNAISGATFLSELSQPPAGSPPGSPVVVVTPDTIEIAGDVTASFPVDKAFAIRDSLDATYGSYDGTYRVHIDGAVAGGSPLTTVIPIGTIEDSSFNQPLLPFYQPDLGSPPGSPVPVVPAPSPFGDVYITPIVGIDQVSAAVAGIDGDYTETDSLGNDVATAASTDYVVFNYDILTGSKIETLKYT